MSARLHLSRRQFVIGFFVLAAAQLVLVPLSYAQEARKGVPAAEGMELVLPIPDAARGRQIFVNRGCIICHSINKVGGKIAPALDVGPDHRQIEPFGFMARMWRGAKEMIRLQNMELGYRIDFDGDELAHLIGFLSDPKAQKSFSDRDIPDIIRDMIIMDPNDWPQRGMKK